MYDPLKGRLTQQYRIIIDSELREIVGRTCLNIGWIYRTTKLEWEEIPAGRRYFGRLQLRWRDVIKDLRTIDTVNQIELLQNRNEYGKGCGAAK